MSEPSPPDFAALEERLVEELQTALAGLVEEPPDEPLAAIVLWAAPYKGWYEVHIDTATRNLEGARARNAHWLTLLPELTQREDAWRSAATTSRRLQALPFDPRYGEFTSCDEPIHEFEQQFTDFVTSPAYAALNVDGEDGWLEGHVRGVIARAIARLVEAHAFDPLPRAPHLHIGYAYPDSSEAIIVAIVEH